MKVQPRIIDACRAIALMLLFLTCAAPALAEEVGAVAMGETAVAVDIITNIDANTRTITLKNEMGDKWDFVAGPEVKNFDQLKRGDLVITEYFAGFALALEPKGSGLEERASDYRLESAAPGEKPGMAYSESTYILAKVAAVDADSGTITFEGANGTLTMAVADDVDLSGVEAGQELEVLYVESLAISVEPAPKVSGTLEFKLKAVAIGVGYEWGEGTLTMYDGSSHDVKVRGLTLVDVGITTVEASGDVYHLVEAKDVEGRYVSGEAGAVLVGGGSALAMKNRNGVVLKLKSKQKGARLTLAGEGLKIELK